MNKELNNTNFTITQAGELLGYKPQTIRNWAARGWILHVPLPNGRKVIPASEIERLSRPIQQGGSY